MYMWFVRAARAVFLRAAGAARARCIIARLLEPALAAALNQPKRARQIGFLRAARSAAVGDALRQGKLSETRAVGTAGRPCSGSMRDGEGGLKQTTLQW